MDKMFDLCCVIYDLLICNSLSYCRLAQLVGPID